MQIYQHRWHSFCIKTVSRRVTAYPIVIRNMSKLSRETTLKRSDFPLCISTDSKWEWISFFYDCLWECRIFRWRSLSGRLVARLLKLDRHIQRHVASLAEVSRCFIRTTFSLLYFRVQGSVACKVLNYFAPPPSHLTF